MIACDDTDLFGGRISVISSPEFCCQVETVGAGLLPAPFTAIHDLLPAGLDRSGAPVLRLIYDSVWGADSLLVRHRSIVSFLDAMAERENVSGLQAALELVSREFRYYGEWKWPAAEAQFTTRPRERGSLQINQSAFFLRDSVQPAAVQLVRPCFADYYSHSDSPLAD